MQPHHKEGFYWGSCGVDRHQYTRTCGHTLRLNLNLDVYSKLKWKKYWYTQNDTSDDCKSNVMFEGQTGCECAGDHTVWRIMPQLHLHWLNTWGMERGWKKVERLSARNRAASTYVQTLG